METPRALAIARTAERFGRSPATTYLGVTDPVMVTLLDEALALRLSADDARLHAKAWGKRGIDADQRYATDADYADDDHG